MTVTDDSRTEVRDPLNDGNYAPVDDEVTVEDLPVEGTLPADLTGRLLRIGPNPVATPEPPLDHWFIGTGMVHGVRIRDGRVDWYRNRYIRSDRVTEAKGWPDVAGPRHGMGDGTANTNVIGHGGKTFAVVEAGSPPVELTYDLETVARSDFDGTLPGSFTAHPKVDPATGELHAVVYYWEWPYLQYLVVGTDGLVRKRVDVPVPGGPMTHDVGLSERNVMLFDLPCVFDLEIAMTGTGFPYRWSDDYQARVGVLPRDGDAEDVRWCEVEPCYVFHPLNAYDLPDGRIVMDVVRHPKMFAEKVRWPMEGGTTLDRWTIDPASATVREERLSDVSQEFPRHDERLVGRRHRFAYAGHWGVREDGPPGYGPIYKHDVDRGTTEVHDFGPGTLAQEPVFVPVGDDAAEDDGWIMVYVHDATRDAADIHVLHAQDFTGDPVATIHLPVRVPFGFHGNWVPDSP